MPCPSVNAFFSCSFQEVDININDFFKSICEGLNIQCKNVSDGYTSTPPDTARKLIDESKVVLAIITKRDETTTGKGIMPSAVHEEISMAYALQKPTLIVIEESVSRDGFLSNFGTFIVFNRDKLYTDEFIKKVVSSLHELRMEAVEQHDLLPDQDASGFYAENVSFLIELVQGSPLPKWNYSSTRKLVFTRPHVAQIKNSAWAEYVPENYSENIDFTSDIKVSRDDLQYTLNTTRNTPSQLEITIDFEEKPKKDDWIELEFNYSSSFLNPLSREDVDENKCLILSGKKYHCCDGMIPIQPTREMNLQIRFPSWYKIDKNSIYPFVGSYSAGVDYIVESEIKRCNIKETKFGGTTIIDISVESPLMRHLYGVAWNFAD